MANIFDKLASIEERYHTLSEEMADPAVVSDLDRLQQLAREQRDLEPLITTFQDYKRTLSGIEETQLLLNDGLDSDMRALAQEELDTLRSHRLRLEEEIKLLLVPRDANDEKDVVCEVRQGEGGDEAALFAANLYRMYVRYAERRGWKLEVINLSENEIGGFKEIVFEMRGEGVYSRMKYEGGVHRVQRVPETEARGRIHTSTATVAVLPKMEANDIDLRPDDYRIDVFRAGGHGGQGVNTTDSAVRIVYKPGTPDEIIVTCQNERSQLKNRDAALSVLRAKLYVLEQERHQQAVGASRLAQVGTGERAEKIRTYNFPQDRITDHRIGENFSGLPAVLDGDLDKIIDSLVVYDNTERLKAAGMA